MQAPVPKPTTQPPIHWPSVWQLGLSSLALLVVWSMGLWLAFLALNEWITQTMSGAEGNAVPLLLMAAGAIFGGFLLLPSAGYAFLRLIGRPTSWTFRPRYPGLAIVLLVPALLLGHLAAENPQFAWIALPPIHVIAVGLSVYWLLTLGQRGLALGSPQRTWGVFTGGFVLAPTLSLIAELAAIAAVAVLGGFYLSNNPVLAEKVAQLTDVLANDPAALENLRDQLEPFLLQPVVLYTAITFVAVLVPLIEELVKPIGVWLLVGRDISGSQGFVAGLISGAGYALFENLSLSSGTSEGWAVIILARMGTSLMHILTAGLSGWALAEAWKNGSYLRLGFTYLAVVFTHGIWNVMALMTAGAELLPPNHPLPERIIQMGNAAPLGLVILTGAAFVLLIWINISLRRAIIPPASAQPSSQTTPVNGHLGDENLTNKEYPIHGID
jgi:hypothetical protein